MAVLSNIYISSTELNIMLDMHFFFSLCVNYISNAAIILKGFNNLYSITILNFRPETDDESTLSFDEDADNFASCWKFRL